MQRNFPRLVKVAEEFIYMGKTLGNVKVARMEIKGSPEAWVREALDRGRNLKELAGYCFKLACDENKRHRHEVGKKQGHRVFWRNAFGYANNLLKKQGKVGINTNQMDQVQESSDEQTVQADS